MYLTQFNFAAAREGIVIMIWNIDNGSPWKRPETLSERGSPATAGTSGG
jgi:hypothetical protein